MRPQRRRKQADQRQRHPIPATHKPVPPVHLPGKSGVPIVSRTHACHGAAVAISRRVDRRSGTTTRPTIELDTNPASPGGERLCPNSAARTCAGPCTAPPATTHTTKRWWTRSTAIPTSRCWRARQTAALLFRLGVRKGDRVALMMRPSTIHPIALYSCWELSAVPVCAKSCRCWSRRWSASRRGR
ncbi:AMP-binding protein [Immundisolibacter sp.]